MPRFSPWKRRRRQNSLSRRPVLWLAIVLIALIFNLGVVIITVHQYLNVDVTPSSLSLKSELQGRKAEPSPIENLFDWPSFGRASLENARKIDPSSRMHGKEQTSTELNEAILWRRLSQEQVLKHRCPDFRTVLMQDNKTDSEPRAVLPALGFWHNIQELAISGSIEARSQPLIQSSIRVNHSNSKRSCFLPPTTSCESLKYSVVVTSKLKDLRRLFLHLLTFQSYPSVSEVSLILPSGEALHSLQADRKYGNRILEWKHKGKLTQLLYEPSIWESFQALTPSESTVLLVDGDIPRKNWNRTQLDANFRMSREHSLSVISPSAPKQQSGSVPSCPLGNFGFHLSFFHRNWLCFVDHPIFYPVRDYLSRSGGLEAQPNAWADVLSISLVLWIYLGDGMITTPEAQIRANATSTTNPHLEAVFEYFGCHCRSQRSTMIEPNRTTSCS